MVFIIHVKAYKQLPKFILKSFKSPEKTGIKVFACWFVLGENKYCQRLYTTLQYAMSPSFFETTQSSHLRSQGWSHDSSDQWDVNVFCSPKESQLLPTGCYVDMVKVSQLPPGRHGQHPRGMAEQQASQEPGFLDYSKAELSFLYLLASHFYKREIHLFYSGQNPITY